MQAGTAADAVGNEFFYGPGDGNPVQVSLIAASRSFKVIEIQAVHGQLFDIESGWMILQVVHVAPYAGGTTLRLLLEAV